MLVLNIVEVLLVNFQAFCSMNNNQKEQKIDDMLRFKSLLDAFLLLL